jgi:hypothetical protein
MRTRLYLGIDFHIRVIFFRESSKSIKGVTVKVKTRHSLNSRNLSSIPDAIPLQPPKRLNVYTIPYDGPQPAAADLAAFFPGSRDRRLTHASYIRPEGKLTYSIARAPRHSRFMGVVKSLDIIATKSSRWIRRRKLA